MKKIKLISMMFCFVFLLTSCKGVFEAKPKVNINNVIWEVKMGINYLDDRAAMVEFTNNTEYTITELALNFKMKDNIKEEKLDEFYTHLKKDYNLSDDVIIELRENGISMNSHAYLDEEEYIEKGEKIEETLLYGLMFIKNLDYYDLFEPEMYKIVYINDLGEESITYYDYLNKTYNEK